MTNIRTFLATMATGFALLALVSPCFAVERPFKGNAEGILSFTSPSTAIVDYTGEATHLGHFTRREFLTIDGSFVFGNMIFTAANGDELWLDFDGMFISPNDAIGTYTFTGGTGRFVDATGEADFVAFSPDFIDVFVTFEGTLNY